MRAFLAVAVREPALAAVRSLKEELRAEIEGVRWVSPQLPHLTLRFFGELEARDISRVVTATQRAVAGMPPFAVRLRDLGVFPPGDPSRARVLWAGVEESPALRALEGRISAELLGAGLGGDERPFHPHCTLGRPGRRWGDGAAWRARAEQGVVLPPFLVTEVGLYETRGGYHLLDEVPFR